jgi:hypothetical protein
MLRRLGKDRDIRRDGPCYDSAIDPAVAQSVVGSRQSSMAYAHGPPTTTMDMLMLAPTPT